MARMRIKYVWEDVDRHGNVRRYFVRSGQKKIRLRGVPGTREVADEYDRAIKVDINDIKPKEVEQRRALRGSLRWLIEQYYGSSDFKRLEPSTQNGRRGILDSLSEEPISENSQVAVGSLPFASMPTSKVRALGPPEDREDGIVGVPEDRIQRTLTEVKLDLSAREKEFENLYFPCEKLFDTFEWQTGYLQHWKFDPGS